MIDVTAQRVRAATATSQPRGERAMTASPKTPGSDDDNAESASSPAEGHASGEAPGAEIGISEGDGSSFEPEEDPEA
jgi:hypothetical protein